VSYNGSGTFVINSTGQPVVTGTVISSSTFNSLTADLGTGLTTAITKDGQTTTTAKIPFAQGLSAAVASNFAAGTVGAPSIYLSTDTTTGLYRIGANNDGFAISGVKLLDLSSALVGITGALTVSTTLNVTGVATLGNGAVLGTPASGTVTNLTGTASININGTVGATTPTTGAFTNLKLSSNNLGIRTDTADGSDDGYLAVSGGGGEGVTRGGFMYLSGNERAGAAAGTIKIYAGNVAAGDIYFYTANEVERLRISNSGIVTMGVYGAGAATFSAAGVISSVSDETWKTKDGIPTNPDAMLKKLAPGYWYYNDEKKETFGADRQLGFYAQNVNAAIGPEAAPEPERVTTKNEDGTETITTKPWGYYDRSVLAVAVMSLQKALTRLEALESK
jgi:hypothetical protein